MSNKELDLAAQIIEKTDSHLFLTGKAGTGKTTFLRNLFKTSQKRMVILAPTGIAAINAGGTSIHSFFQLSFAPYVPESLVKLNYKLSKKKRRLIKNLDLIIIDEISMVRADLLDEIDTVLRAYRNTDKPFGGVQMLFIGDLQQLPPVVTAADYDILKDHYSSFYFFGSKVLQETPYFIVELKKIYRQNDKAFIDILNSIRENRITDEQLKLLNSRYLPNFSPSAEEGYIRLVTHNRQAHLINRTELDKIPREIISFNAVIEGDYPESSYPTDEKLNLKKGAQVMLVKNDPKGEYYNGSIGEIIYLTQKDIHVKLHSNGAIISIGQEVWENVKYELNEKTNSVEENVIGRFIQYPLKTAWAITVHKSQGLTFEKAIIDATDAFAHGQTYVALSRCKTLDGLVLRNPISMSAIISDRDVTNFIGGIARHTPDDALLATLKKNYFFSLVSKLFNFDELSIRIARLSKIMNENFLSIYPEEVAKFGILANDFILKIYNVSKAFEDQYSKLINESDKYEEDKFIRERISKGAAYFSEELRPIIDYVDKTAMPTDNKERERRFNLAVDSIKEQLEEKDALLRYVRDKGFSVDSYQRILSIVIGKDGEEKKRSSRTSSKRQKLEAPQDIQDPELFEKLRVWRKQEAEKIGKPAFWILTQKTLTNIVNIAPKSIDKLCQIHGVGPKTIERYGDKIIEIIREHED